MRKKAPAKVVTSLVLRDAGEVDGSTLPGRDSEANQNVKGLSTLIARNITVNGRRTSVRMEPEVWLAIEEISRRERIGRNYIFTTIANRLRPHQSLSSAIRVFVISYYRDSSTESGHVRAGHGLLFGG